MSDKFVGPVTHRAHIYDHATGAWLADEDFSHRPLPDEVTKAPALRKKHGRIAVHVAVVDAGGEEIFSHNWTERFTP